MNGTATDLTWVRGSRAQIADLHWLAYAEAVETGSPRAAGMTGALDWLAGRAPAPVTGRAERPVTSALAEAELWSARALLGTAVPPLEEISRNLGVTHSPPRAIGAGRAEGVAAVLAWLLGLVADAPLALPVRDSNGRPADVQTLVETAIAAAPHRTWGPEERHAARAEARETVERTRRLLDRIAAAQRQVG